MACKSRPGVIVHAFRRAADKNDDIVIHASADSGGDGVGNIL
jgi:hypothetical protein